MNAGVLRIGTRASALALWQAQHVAELIRAQPGAPRVELVHIKTEGAVRTDIPLWAVAGRAFFTKEIDRAQLAGEVDIAVHSLKDLSTTIAEGLELTAVLEREDPCGVDIGAADQFLRTRLGGADQLLALALGFLAAAFGIGARHGDAAL